MTVGDGVPVGALPQPKKTGLSLVNSLGKHATRVLRLVACHKGQHRVTPETRADQVSVDERLDALQRHILEKAERRESKKKEGPRPVVVQVVPAKKPELSEADRLLQELMADSDAQYTASRSLKPLDTMSEEEFAQMMRSQPGSSPDYQPQDRPTSAWVGKGYDREGLRYRGKDPALKAPKKLYDDASLTNEHGLTPAEVKELKRQAKIAYREQSARLPKTATQMEKLALRRNLFNDIAAQVVQAKKAEKLSELVLPEEKRLQAEKKLEGLMQNSPLFKAMLGALGATAYGGMAVANVLGVKGVTAIVFSLLWGQAGATGTCHVTNFVQQVSDAGFQQNRDMLVALCRHYRGSYPTAGDAQRSLAALTSQRTPDQLSQIARPCLDAAHTETSGSCQVQIENGPNLSPQAPTTLTTPTPTTPGTTLGSVPVGSTLLSTAPTTSTLNATTGTVQQTTVSIFQTPDGVTVQQTTVTTVSLTSIRQAVSSTPPGTTPSSPMPTTTSTVRVVDPTTVSRLGSSPTLASRGPTQAGSQPTVSGNGQGNPTQGASDTTPTTQKPAQSQTGGAGDSQAISQELVTALIVIAVILALLIAVGLAAYCCSDRFKEMVDGLIGRCRGQHKVDTLGDVGQVKAVNNPVYGLGEYLRLPGEKQRQVTDSIQHRQNYLLADYQRTARDQVCCDMLTDAGRAKVCAGTQPFDIDVSYLVNQGQFDVLQKTTTDPSQYLQEGLVLGEGAYPTLDQLNLYGTWALREYCNLNSQGQEEKRPLPAPPGKEDGIHNYEYVTTDEAGYLQIHTYDEPDQVPLEAAYELAVANSPYEEVEKMPELGTVLEIGGKKYIFHGDSKETAAWCRWTEELEASYQPVYDQATEEVYEAQWTPGDTYDLGSGSNALYDEATMTYVSGSQLHVSVRRPVYDNVTDGRRKLGDAPRTLDVAQYDVADMV